MIARPQSCLIALSVLALLLVCPGTACGAAGKPPASRYFTLDNGLQVFLEEKHDLPLAAVALAVNLGTKDETEQTSGYAHLLEHMLLFGANAELDGEARIAELRSHGIAHNAHTDHDLMTFEVSCPAADGIWALERLRQTVFFSRFDPQQLESEKRIILEEILQLRDNPLFLGRTLVMQQLFTGHPYGQPVFGDGSTIKAATVDSLQVFYERWLTPGSSALAVVGDFSLAEMEKEIRRNWGILEKSALTAAAIPAARRLEKNVESQVELDIQESHLFLGWQAPEFNHEQRLAVTLLTQILGSGLNPLLHEVLLGRQRLAEQLDMSYMPLGHGGMILLHLTLKEKDIRNAKSAVSKFLREIDAVNFSREDVQPQYQMYVLDYLGSAKNRMTYQSENFRESVLNLSLASARFLLLNRNPITGNYLESVEKVNSSDLRQAAGKYLSGKKWVALAVTPLAVKAK